MRRWRRYRLRWRLGCAGLSFMLGLLVLRLVFFRRGNLDVLALAVGLLMRGARRVAGVSFGRDGSTRSRVLVFVIVVAVDEGPGAPAAAAPTPARGARGPRGEAMERPCTGDRRAPPCARIEMLAQAREVVLSRRLVGCQPLQRRTRISRDDSRRQTGVRTWWFRASSAVGRLCGSGLSSVFTKSLAASETWHQYRSWNSIFASVVSRMSSFMSSDRKGE